MVNMSEINLTVEEKAVAIVALFFYGDEAGPAATAENLNFFSSSFVLECLCRARFERRFDHPSDPARSQSADRKAVKAIFTLMNSGVELESGFAYAEKGYPTTINPACLVLAAPSDPSWQIQYRHFKIRRAQNRKMGRNSDDDLCSIQVDQNNQGFELAEIVKTIHGYSFRTVFSGGVPFGPYFETFDKAEEWGVTNWHAVEPGRRELIVRGGRR